MSAATTNNPDLPERLTEAITAYLEAAESGPPPERHEWLARYPELAVELAAFLDDKAVVDPVVASLREIAQAGAPAGALPGDTAWPSALSVQELPSIQAQTFGDYQILEEIGCGGMGVVYKARQKSLNRLVALKMIRAGTLASAEDKQRFQHEAETAAALDYPHIVPIYEVGELERQPYFTMKLLRAMAKTDVCTPNRVAGAEVLRSPGGVQGFGVPQPRPPNRLRQARQRQTASLLATVARAVHHAHQRGVLHRDLKPANILLDENDQPVVTDFGLAKRLTATDAENVTLPSGQPLGTPAFMAPEQAAGDKKTITVLTDVYGLGAVLFSLLTGRPPFMADAIPELFDQIRHHPPTPPRRLDPEIDRDLETICLKCLEKDPERRYPSAADLADDLERWLAGEPILARPVGRVNRLWRWCRRNPALATAAGVAVAAVVALAVSSVFAWLGWAEASRQRDVAELQKQKADANAAEAQRQEQYAQEWAASLVQGTSLLQQIGNSQEAEKMYRLVLDVVRRREGPAPRSRSARYLLASAHHNLGTLYASQGKLPAAEGNYRLALELRRKLSAESPADRLQRHETGKLLHNLADVLDDSNRPEDAEKLWQEARSVHQALVKEAPAVPDYKAMLAQELTGLAGHWKKRDRTKEALAAYQDALKLGKELVADFPGIPVYRRVLGYILNNLGLFLFNSARLAEAGDALGQALDLRKQLLLDDPNNPDYLSECGATLNNQAFLFTTHEKLAESCRNLEEAIRHQRAALQTVPSHATYRRFLKNHYYVLADTRLMMHMDAEAAQAAEELPKIYPQSWQEHHRAAGLIAQCAGIAQTDKKQSETQRQERSERHARRAVELLDEAVLRGFKDAPALKNDTNFEPLRRRDDFKHLIDQMATKP